MKQQSVTNHYEVHELEKLLACKLKWSQVRNARLAKYLQTESQESHDDPKTLVWNSAEQEAHSGCSRIQFYRFLF